MAKLAKIETATRNGKGGYDFIMEKAGLSRFGVRGRINAELVTKFPIKSGEIEFVREERVFGDTSVPTRQQRFFIPRESLLEKMTIEKFKEVVSDLSSSSGGDFSPFR